MTQSLQYRLSVAISIALLSVALTAGAVTFVLTFYDAIESQDEQLAQIALLLSRQRLPMSPGTLHDSGADVDPEARVVVQFLRTMDGTGMTARGELPGLPDDLPDGFQTVEVRDDSWRIFVKTLATGARVAVGQRTTVREEIARDNALRAVTPVLILIPLLVLLVGHLIRKMFRPLKRLAADLDRRAEQDLQELSDADLPAEIRPFVVAINRLLARVAHSVTAERRFVADAAHELRSPLTALSLQAERLADADLPAAAAGRLASLRDGIRRAQGMVEQLLTLARVQATNTAAAGPVSVNAVFRHVLEDLMPLAESKHIDLGVVSVTDVSVRGAESDLGTLVKNLVDNAIRYTPDGGRIDLCVEARGREAVLRVLDSGPGIPADQRERVFDAFYRVVGNEQIGSGLGLSIVRVIAARLGARVRLSDAEGRSGLCAEVVFPLTPDAGGGA